MTLHDTVGSHASVSVLFGVSADGMPKSETGIFAAGSHRWHGFG